MVSVTAVTVVSSKLSLYRNQLRSCHHFEGKWQHNRVNGRSSRQILALTGNQMEKQMGRNKK